MHRVTCPCQIQKHSAKSFSSGLSMAWGAGRSSSRLRSEKFCVAVNRAIWESCALVFEQLFCLLPHPCILPVLQLEKTGQQSRAERFGGLSGQKRWKVVDADHAQRKVVRTGVQLDGNCGTIKGCVDVVDGDRVVWVRGVARYVAHNAQLAAGCGKRLRVDERRNLRRQIDAVDKNIRLNDLLVWSWLGAGLWQVPFLCLNQYCSIYNSLQHSQ